MKRIALIFIIALSVLTLNAKTRKIVGELTATDTTLMVQDAADANVYKFVGKITNKSFRLFDGTDYYIPVCGMNDPFGQAVGMEKQVDVAQAGFRVSYVNTNQIYKITLTEGTAPKIIVETAVPYKHIYLIGGPVNTNNPNWLLRDARELEKDPENPYVFYYRGFLKYNTFGDERGAIKFLTSNTSWDPGFHPVGTSNVPLAQASKMRLNGSDTKWEIPADGSRNGYYVIKLNTLEETISVEQFQQANVDFPNNIFITGDAMPCGWVNGEPMVMTPTNILEGKYSWTGNVVPGQFKFLKTRGTWGSCYVSTVRDQPVVYGTQYPVVYEADYISQGGNDFKFVITEADRCVFNIDLVNMKLVITKDEESAVDDLNSENGLKISSGNANIKITSTSATKKHLEVFSIGGQKLHESSFVHNTNVPLSKGYYIVKVTDSKAKLCKKVGVF